MSEQTIRFQYKTGIVTGGYSFSLHNNIIILSDYVETLDNDRLREAIKYEAERARHHYVTEVKRLKSVGQKVNTYLVKREAVNIARLETQIKFADVWGEVESTYKTHSIPETLTQPPMATAYDDSNDFCNRNKKITFTVTVRDSDNIILDVTKERSSKRLSDYL